MVAADTTKLWQEIRARRARPVGLAADDEARAATFRAALRQAQELADAAAAAGYASRPLPLFYALGASLRAISAAMWSGPGWVIRGHGARVETGTNVLDTTITPYGGGATMLNAVQRMTSNSDSPLLMSSTMTIRAIWAAAPDTPVLPNGLLDDAPRAIRAHMPISKEVAKRAQEEGRLEIALEGIDAALDDESLRKCLEAYPALNGAQLASDWVTAEGFNDFYGRDLAQPTWQARTGRFAIPLLGYDWSSGAPVISLPVDLTIDGVDERTSAGFQALGVRVGSDDNIRLIQPALGGADEVTFLTAWWLLLLGLSQLVRYEPAIWISAIDLDRSELGQPLELVCDRAASLIPSVLAEYCSRDGDDGAS